MKDQASSLPCRVVSEHVVASCIFAWLWTTGAGVAADTATGDASAKTRNVVIVTLDGFRWQEFFGGAEEGLMEPDAGGVRDRDALRRRYLRDSTERRREALLPFIWGTIATQGQVFGDPFRHSPAVCTNGMKFSYPGYNELFCGFGDERITSNDKRDNPNPSVLEFLGSRPPFRGRVAAFCTWGVFPYIFRQSRNGLKVHAGWTPIVDEPLTDQQRATNELIATLPRYWPDNTFDVVVWQIAREHLLRHQPRVLYISLGETDEWGHGRRYDLYLDAAHQADRMLGEFWQMLQNLPEYRDSTTLLLSTDHGRGATRGDWTDHGQQVHGAENIWIAVLGPDTPPLGVRENTAVTQGQVAATIAQLLGEDFNAGNPRASAPLPDVIRVPVVEQALKRKQPPADESRQTTEGIIEAPLDAVWNAFATEDGQEAWNVAHAEIDLKIGGKMLMHYDAKGTIGDANTIENVILAFEPRKMLATQVGKPPEQFPFKEAIKGVWHVVYFDEAGPNRTRVRVVGLGYGADEESRKLRAFFEKGHAYTLTKLQEFLPKK